MPDVLFQHLHQYASQHELRLAEKLGSGIHGLVHLTLKEGSLQESAVKAHHEQECYLKEREAYRRLRRASIHEVQGFHVPQLLNYDDDLLVIEMTIVSKPYLLDFAGVSLDQPAAFSEEIWRDWEAEKREQFGVRWPSIQKVIADLQAYRIYLTDVSPSNIVWE